MIAVTISEPTGDDSEVYAVLQKDRELAKAVIFPLEAQTYETVERASHLLEKFEESSYADYLRFSIACSLLPKIIDHTLQKEAVFDLLSEIDLKTFPYAPNVLLISARLLRRIGKKEDSKQLIQKLVKLFPNTYEANLAYYESLNQEGWTRLLQNSVPKFKQDLQHPEPVVRYWALRSLGWCGQQAEPALPEIEKLLKDENSEARLMAAMVVLSIDQERPMNKRQTIDRKLVVDVLVADGLGNEEKYYQHMSISYLGRCGKHAKRIMPQLINRLDNTEDRWRVVGTLGDLRSDAKDALPALREMLREPDLSLVEKKVLTRSIQQIE